MKPDDYIVGHVRDALATDPRAGVLDVQATVVAGRVVLTGTVASEERGAAVAQVAGEAAGLPVLNELTVLDGRAPGAQEELP